MIKKAALLLKDGSIIAGSNYKTIMNSNVSNQVYDFDCSIIGFIDDEDNFLNRFEAARHAFNCGQIKKKTNLLSAEDLCLQ